MQIKAWASNSFCVALLLFLCWSWSVTTAGPAISSFDCTVPSYTETATTTTTIIEQELPKCTVVNITTNEIIHKESRCLSDGSFLISWERDALKEAIFCSATYPITVEVKLRETKRNVLFNLSPVKVIRSVADIRNTSTYNYTLLIPWGLSYSGQTQVKQYIVHSVRHPAIKTVIMVSPWSSDLLAEIDAAATKKHVLSVETASVRLPCITTTGKYPEGVYKYINDNDSVQNTTEMMLSVDNVALTYRPSEGFTLNTTSYTAFVGKYFCMSLTGLRGRPVLKVNEFELKIGPERIARPNVTKLGVFIGSPELMLLECSSTRPIKLNHVLGEYAVFESLSRRMYQIDKPLARYFLDVKVEGAQFHNSTKLKIQCLEEKTGFEVHSWGIEAVDILEPRINGLAIQNAAKIGTCRFSSSSETTGFKGLACSSPVECITFQRCLHEKYNCQGVVSRVQPCNFLWCEQIQLSLSGSLYCPRGPTQQYVTYFTGFDGNTYLHWKTAPIGSLLKVSILRDAYSGKQSSSCLAHSRSPCLGEDVEVECKAHKFLSGGKLQWVLSLNNSRISARVDQLEELEATEGKDFILRRSKIRIDSLAVSAIICYAPVWDSEEWIQMSSASFIVQEASLPIFTSKDIDFNFRIGDKAVSLICEAEGS